MAIETTGLRVARESLFENNFMRARLQKDRVLMEEIGRISKKDKQARRLEKEEGVIIRRLQEAQELQMETIRHIQNVFEEFSTSRREPLDLALTQNTQIFSQRLLSKPKEDDVARADSQLDSRSN